MNSNILWSPSEEWIGRAKITRFAAQNNLADASYDVLHKWSTSSPDAFWRAVWDFCDVIGVSGETAFVPAPDGGMLGVHWFPEARLNFAENTLRGPDAQAAVVAADEDGITGHFNMGELRAEVSRVAAGLRAAGVGVGDCVAGILPNRIEALVALLATATIGATWSACSPDFGAVAIIDRIGQINPKVLFAAPRYRYGGRDHDISDRLVQIAHAMPSVKSIVTTTESELLAHLHPTSWSEFGEPGLELEFERVPFSQPLYVLYTSGTTGKPKAIVHSAGGVLLQHLKEHQLHCDLRAGDVIGWYSNIAWMMYPWMLSGLASGAAIVLTDGSPIPKTPDGLDCGLLFRLIADAGITHFGISPKFLHTVADAGYVPKERTDLSNLRVFMSAGGPVAPAQFDWIYQHIKSDMMFASISGGTEIIGCFLIGSPTLPVRRGELTCKALGHAVAVMDERNAPIVGRKGDLVCTEPFPSMPLTFWGEGGDQRYHDTYFSDRPGIWTHGDLAEETIHGSGIIYGRTDTTLKPGGVRIGTAEIYETVEKFAEIEDCLVFGLPYENDEEVVLCVKAANGALVDEALASSVRLAVRTAASPRHVPHRIHQVAEIPYTLNGKKVEGAARSTVLGEQVKNRDSLANPASLIAFSKLDREQAL